MLTGGPGWNESESTAAGRRSGSSSALRTTRWRPALQLRIRSTTRWTASTASPRSSELRACGSSIWPFVRLPPLSVATRLATEDSVAYSLAGVNGLAALDRAPGLEIVVTVHHGASTAFGDLFRVENGALARIRIPGFGGEFAYEGSVTHFNVIDCARPRSGLIWISGYGLDDSSHYIQERSLYRLAGDRLAQVRHESSRVSVPTAGRFPEFAEPQPFPHCLVVRNSRIQ